jgi:hypothetical protein
VVGCSREKEWRGRSVPFCGHTRLRKKRGGDGGGPVQAAPCRGMRRGGPGSVAPRGGGRCGGPGVGRGTRPVGADDGRLAREARDEGGVSGRVAADGPLPWAVPRAQCRF